MFRLASLIGLLVLPGCARKESNWHQRFDEDRAWQNVSKLVESGPRPSGSPEAEKAASWIEGELKGFGLRVIRDEFTVSNTPRGKVTFRNIIGTAGAWPIEKETIVLASHYDTKWLPQMRFVGANDGGSSAGCLLEIARVLSEVRLRNVVFVFFDGEEAMEQYTESDGLYGSRHLASVMGAGDLVSRIRAFILLDMIGDKDLNVMIPAGDAELTRRVFSAAEKLGTRGYFSLGDAPILDDHAPFQRAGAPCIDLIDFNYGAGNKYWHTDRDTLEEISPKSLGIVGKTVLKLLEDLDVR